MRMFSQFFGGSDPFSMFGEGGAGGHPGASGMFFDFGGGGPGGMEGVTGVQSRLLITRLN